MGADVLVNGKTQNLKEVGMFWKSGQRVPGHQCQLQDMGY